MVTIIQATNRPDSNTEFISRHVQELIQSITGDLVGYVSMQDLPAEILHSDPYAEWAMPFSLKMIQDNWMIPAEKFIWIIPEYNGSYPGVLKLFIDALSVRRIADTFYYKKSALIGVTNGRSGNIRGLDHLAAVLLQMRSIVFPRLLPLSRIRDLMDDQGRIVHSATLEVLDAHLREFLEF
jgi:NAD(P)H-dependent FMN reductase